MDEKLEEMNRDFDRVASVLQSIDSGKYSICLIMAGDASDGGNHFIVGGNVNPDDRAAFVASFLAAHILGDEVQLRVNEVSRAN
jgi:hypothetical protein